MLSLKLSVLKLLLRGERRHHLIDAADGKRAHIATRENEKVISCRPDSAGPTRRNAIAEAQSFFDAALGEGPNDGDASARLLPERSMGPRAGSGVSPSGVLH
jgi:hypothetical protein